MHGLSGDLIAKKYDAVLTNYNGEMWPENIQKSLVDYVKSGGAFIVVHAANNAFQVGWNTMK